MARRDGGEGAGRASRHGPACQCRARLRFRAGAEQKGGDAGARRRQRQPAGGGQVERLGRPPWLDDHRAEGRAAHRFRPGAEHPERVACLHYDERIRVEAEFRQTGGVKVANLVLGERLAHPQQAAPGRRGAQHECSGKTGSGARIRCAQRENLVQPRPQEPASERAVDHRHAHGKATRGAVELQVRQFSQQGGQAVLRRAHCICSRFVLVSTRRGGESMGRRSVLENRGRIVTFRPYPCSPSVA